MQLNLFGFEKLKKCTRCNEIKKINQYKFTYNKNLKKRILRSYCNDCKKVIDKNYKYKYRNLKRNYRYKNDNIYNLKRRIRASIRHSLKKKNINKNTMSYKILGIDWINFKKHIENQFTDNMSWDNFDHIHIDHKIPIAAASTEFEVIALNHYTNLQPMWAKDNLKKSHKYNIEDFKKYMEWYRKNIK